MYSSDLKRCPISEACLSDNQIKLVRQLAQIDVQSCRGITLDDLNIPSPDAFDISWLCKLLCGHIFGEDYFERS